MPKIMIHNDTNIPKRLRKLGRPVIWRAAFVGCSKINDWFFVPRKRINFSRTYYYWKKKLREENPSIKIEFKLYMDATVKCRECEWGHAKEAYLSQVKHGLCPKCKADKVRIVREGTQVRRVG